MKKLTLMALLAAVLMTTACRANVSPAPTDAPEVTDAPTAEPVGTAAPTDAPAAAGEPEATPTTAPTENGGT